MINGFDHETEKINIPENLKNLPILQLDFSVRLDNVLRRFGVQLLGDLHEMLFEELADSQNCGRKTVNELKGFIDKIQNEEIVRTLQTNYRRQIENSEKDNARRALIE